MYFSANKVIALKRSDFKEPDVYFAASKGDHEAITWLYKEHAPGLFTVCRRYADSKEQAEDWFQDGFLKILEKIGTFRNEANIKTWMHRVMSNFCINQLRKSVNKISWEDIQNSEIEADEAYTETETLKLDTVLEWIQKMPAGYRLVLNMYVVESKSHGEIAKTLGITESTCKSQLFKARRWLKKQISKSEVTNE